jgi:hypothetical protein
VHDLGLGAQLVGGGQVLGGDGAEEEALGENGLARGVGGQGPAWEGGADADEGGGVRGRPSGGARGG